ncbi:MAG: glucodextranase DOMON-like domain-containing protein [Candidatus Zixiibacteriota bacterium]
MSIFKHPKSMMGMSLILVLLLWATSSSTVSSINPENAKTCFDSYVKALQQGSTEEAKRFWNKEEVKRYGTFDWQWDLLTSRGFNPAFIGYKITKAEEKDNYIVLHVEWFYREGKAGPLQKDVRYFIQEDGRTVGANPIFVLTREWHGKNSRHFIYHYESKPDEPSDHLLERMDEFYEKTADFLQVDFWEKIDYYKCDSTQEVGSLFNLEPSLARSQVLNRVVASIQNFVPHEIVHVISYRLFPPDGSRIPPVMLNEGLSYYLGGASFFSSDLLLSWAKRKLKTDENIHLDSLLADPWAYGNNESAGLDASFVQFLIETGGIAKFEKLFTSYRSPEEADLAFEEIYNRDMQRIETEWKEYVMALNPPEIEIERSDDATLLFHLADPTGDDKGDGDYTYPQNQIAQPGIFDLTDLKISYDREWVYFQLKFSDLSHSEITSDTSFNGTFAAIVIDCDHRRKSGNTQLFFGNGNFEFSEEDAFEFAIEVSNAGVLVYDQNWVWQAHFLKADSQKDHMDGSEFYFAIPQKIIGIPDSNWRIQVLTGGETGGNIRTALGVGSFMKVGKIATSNQGGGGVSPHFNPDVYDILSTDRMNQGKILSSFDITKKRKATIPLIEMKRR